MNDVDNLRKRTDMIKPAIVVIGYNRPNSMLRLLDSIKNAQYNNDDITLIISIDYWKADNPCHKVAEEFVWEHGKKFVNYHTTNMGLRKHVLECGDLVKKYEAVILLEDDVVVSPAFYHYAQAACNYYYNDEKAVGIGLFSHLYNGYAQLPFFPQKNGNDTFWWKGVISWGECFCKKQWLDFKRWYDSYDGEFDIVDEIPEQIAKWPSSSWGKYMDYYMYERDKYFVVPYEAYTTNFSEIGVHALNSSSIWQVSMQNGIKEKYCFGDYNNSEKYDFYFEYMDKEKLALILDIDKDELVVDLYGIRNGIEQYKYCLSTRIIDRKVVQSYALNMRPIENNINANNKGTGIYLYDMGIKERNSLSKRKQEYIFYKYYYSGINNKKTVNYIIFEIIKWLKRKIEYK